MKNGIKLTSSVVLTLGVLAANAAYSDTQGTSTDSAMQLTQQQNKNLQAGEAFFRSQ